MSSKQEATKASRKTEQKRPAQVEQQPQVDQSPVASAVRAFGSLAGMPDDSSARHLRQAAVLRMQKTRGNHYVVRYLELNGLVPGQAQTTPAAAVQRQESPDVQRAGEYVPQITSSQGMTFLLLNDVHTERVNVTNARQAPQGAVFQWDWETIDTNNFDALPTVPSEGPRATLRAKTKRYFQEGSLTPQVSVTSSEGIVFESARPISVSVMKPTVDWSTELTAGAGGAEEPRIGNSVFVGDVINIIGTMDNIVDARSANLQFLNTSLRVAPAGRFAIGQVEWTGANTFKVPVRAEAAGDSIVSINVYVPGREEPITHTVKVTGQIDARQFKDRCTTAIASTQEMFSAARVYFLTASNNFKQGYEAHKAALDAQNARDKLMADLILGVLFATVGGAAGGAIGGLLKTTATKIAKATSEAAAGAVTDAAKDLTKYIVRLPPTFMRGSGSRGGSGSGQPGGAGGLPTTPSGVAGRGAGAPAAQDPFGWFLGVETALESTKTQVSGMLRQLHEAADLALSSNDPTIFDWDPVAVVENASTIEGTRLDHLGDVPSALEYERAFWITWLTQYAWTLGASVNVPTDRVTHYAEANVGKDLRKAINQVAAKFGESGDEWIRRYGGESRAREEARAEELNQIERG